MQRDTPTCAGATDVGEQRGIMRHYVWESLRADERVIRGKLTAFTLLFYFLASAVVIGLVTIFEPSSITKREYQTQVSVAPHALSLDRN